MKSLTALVLSALMLASPGCAWLSNHGKAAEAAAIDCAKQDLGQTVADAGMSLLMTVTSILFQGGSNWKADLAALEAKFGPDAIACAVSVSEAFFRGPAAGSGSDGSAAPGPSTSDRVESPHDRAQGLLDSRGWKFKK